MYRPVRPGQGIINQVRYQGIGQGDACCAQRRRIVTLVNDAIKDEAEAEKKYKHLLDELTKNQQSIPEVSKVVDLISHIRNQELQHKAIFEQLILRISR